MEYLSVIVNHGIFVVFCLWLVFVITVLHLLFLLSVRLLHLDFADFVFSLRVFPVPPSVFSSFFLYCFPSRIVSFLLFRSFFPVCHSSLHSCSLPFFSHFFSLFLSFLLVRFHSIAVFSPKCIICFFFPNLLSSFPFFSCLSFFFVRFHSRFPFLL